VERIPGSNLSQIDWEYNARSFIPVDWEMVVPERIDPRNGMQQKELEDARS